MADEDGYAPLLLLPMLPVELEIDVCGGGGTDMPRPELVDPSEELMPTSAGGFEKLALVRLEPLPPMALAGVRLESLRLLRGGVRELPTKRGGLAEFIPGTLSGKAGMPPPPGVALL